MKDSVTYSVCKQRIDCAYLGGDNFEEGQNES